MGLCHLNGSGQSPLTEEFDGNEEALPCARCILHSARIVNVADTLISRNHRLSPHIHLKRMTCVYL